MDDLDNARYVAFTTFTRAGTPKFTPVWLTGNGGIYRFYTGATSWKVKRLRNHPAVEVRVCDMRGRIAPHTTVYTGTGQILDDQESLAEVKQAILAKYGWQARLVRVTDTVKEWLGRGETPIAVQIHIDIANIASS